MHLPLGDFLAHSFCLRPDCGLRDYVNSMYNRPTAYRRVQARGVTNIT